MQEFIPVQDSTNRVSTISVSLAFFGLALMFGVFLVVFFETNDVVRVGSSYFNISTLMIIGSTVLVVRLNHYLKYDQLQKVRKTVVGTLILGAIFLFEQLSGWKEISNTSHGLQRDIVLVLISMHALHFVADLTGLCIFLGMLLKLRNGAELYLFLLDVRRKFFVKMILLSNQFLAFLWVTIYVTFQIHQ